jgi:dihydroorotase-like cyclic amidohydrolase
MEVELVLANAKVVASDRTIDRGWVAVDGERIAAVDGNGVEPPRGARTVDLQGRVVLPGIIDPHTHPGNYAMLRDEIASETASAALGGITTILGIVKSTRLGGDYKPLVSADDVTSYLDVFEEGRAVVEHGSFVDVAFTFVIMGDDHAAEIPRYAAELGVTSFKFFPSTAQTAWHAAIGTPSTGDDGTLYLGLTKIREIGGLASFHPENGQVVRILEQQIRGSGEEGLAAWARRSPGFLEAADVRKVATFAEQTGTTIYPVHISSREGVAEIGATKERGLPIVAETCPRYLVLTVDHDRKPIEYAKTTPPVRSAEDRDRLWEALAAGTLDTVGSDHSPMSREAKNADGGFWAARAGLGDTGTLLPLLLSEGVNAGRITLRRLVEVSSETPARTFGLWPRKGRIAPGADADLVVVDLELRRPVRAAGLRSICDFSPYEGMELKGWPVMTVLRGRQLLDGQSLSAEPFGEYLARTPA